MFTKINPMKYEEKLLDAREIYAIKMKWNVGKKLSFDYEWVNEAYK